MNIDTMKFAAKNLRDLAVKNSPTILTTVGVIGSVTTAVLTARGTIKAIRILDEEAAIRTAKWSRDTGEHESSYPGDVLSKKEMVIYTWKCYIPAIAVGLVTITSIVGANRISLRRQAALASLYSLTEQAAKQYEQKVIETLGEKKAEKIKEDIIQDKLNETPVSKSTIVNTGKGQHLCFDMMSGRYFYSDLETIRKVVNDFNKEIILDGSKSLNEFYDALELDHIQMGDLMGWGTDYGFLEIAYRSKLTDTGEPCIVLDYKVEPRQI